MTHVNCNGGHKLMTWGNNEQTWSTAICMIVRRCYVIDTCAVLRNGKRTHVNVGELVEPDVISEFREMPLLCLSVMRLDT